MKNVLTITKNEPTLLFFCSFFYFLYFKLDVSYAGIFYDDKKALEHSLGNIDVNTREIVNNFDPKKWNVNLILNC